MTTLANMLAAAQRLLNYYNGDEKTAQNPGGLTGVGGMADNWDPCIQDIGTVANGVGTAMTAASTSEGNAAASASAAAGSAQSAQQNAQATAVDRQATGQDRQATAQDRQAVAQDRTAVEGSASAAAGSATLAGQYANAAGGSLPSVRLTWDTATTDADPGNGKVRLNNATPSAATALYVDNVDAAGASIATVLDRWTFSTAVVKGTLRIAHRTDATKWLEYQVTGTVVDGTGYRKITVTGGTGPGGFTAGDPVAVGFSRAGDVGPQGAAGGPVYYSAVTAGTPNAQTLAGPLASLAGNPSVEFIAGISNGAASRNNICFLSSDFDTTWATFGGATVFANAAPAPDGTNTADAIHGPSGSGVNRGIAVPADTLTRVYSVFLKAGTSTACRFYFNCGATPAGVDVNLSAGTISAWTGAPVASAIDPIPGGWWRVSIACTNNGQTVIGPHIFPVQASGTGAVYAWGAQIEVGTVPTAPIPTTTSGPATVRDGYMTLAVGSTPPRPLLDAQGRALAPGALVAGTKYTATYDGAAWRLSGTAMTRAQAHALAASFL